MSTDWNRIADEATEATDAHFATQIASLTRLNSTEINTLISESGISKRDLATVFKVLKESTTTNEAKANAIRNTSKGLQVLVALAAKVL
jgi:hypothetical protein